MKLYKLLCLIPLLISFSACDLDKEPYGLTSFWNSEGDAWAGLAAAYQPFYEENGFGRGHWWTGPLSDDMIYNRDRANEDPLVNFPVDKYNVLTTNNSGGLRDFWVYMYRVIRRSNDVMKNVPNIQMSEESHDIMLGEANFLCAFAYFELAKRYGGLPFYDYNHPTETNKPRETLNETYTHIETYLKTSITHFEKQNLWKRSDKDWGRPNLGAAYGLLAKVYAHWATGDPSKYRDCKTMCEKVIGKYNLDMAGNNGFAHLFSLAGEKHEEVLFNLTNSPERNKGSVTSTICLSGTLSGGTGWYYFAPTQSLKNAFDKGDLRQRVTIVGIGDKVNYLGKETILNNTNLSDMRSGLMCNKYLSVYNTLTAWAWESGQDVPLFRYADVLLLHAEAEIFLAGGGPNNRDLGVPAAAASFNEVRVRAFGGDVTKAIASPTFNDLVKERRCELAYEGAREFDLVRWGLAKEVYADGTGDPKGKRYFNPEIHNYLALPQKEIDNSDGILINNPRDGYSNFNPAK